MLPVEQPFKTYTDLNGKPLNGYIYFGVANQNPITSPVTVYWDAAGTQPASQPLRAVNGYIVRAGTPANVFFSGPYSELVQDLKKRQVFYARTSNDFSLGSIFTSTIGSSLIGFIQNLPGALLRTVQSKLREWVHVTDLGCVADGDAATYAGTDNSAALQALFNNAVTAGIVAQGGATRIFPSGVFCFDTPLVVDLAGVSFLRLIGNGNGTRLIYRGAAGTGLSFISTGYDGNYDKLNSRITLENFMVYGQPAQVAAGNTVCLSFINCAEVKLYDVKVHYANQGMYIKDSPNLTLYNCEAIDNNVGISLKKTTTFSDSDLANINIYSPICSGNTIDLKIDGGRDIKIFGGVLASTQSVNIRASGSTSAGDQVENVNFFGTFFDFTDYTTSTIQLGNPADTTFQIKNIGLYGCTFATNALFTKAIIDCNSPLLINVSVDGGYCSEVVPNFLVIRSGCSPTFEFDINNLGANSCMSYRVRDERSVTQRSELFEHYPSLQLNPEFYYFPAGGYLPMGYDQTQVGSVARYTAAFVTGDCALTLSGIGNPVPQAAPIWYPQYGDVTVEQGSDLVIEWIILAPTTPVKNTLLIATTNIDGSGAAVAVADSVLTSVVQEFANGYKRLIHVYKVPNNKVVTSIRVQGAVGETMRLDYFDVHGPVKYRPPAMLYPGGAADFANANFKIAKFRGQQAMKRVTGEDDVLFACRKDAAGTFSWQTSV